MTTRRAVTALPSLGACLMALILALSLLSMTGCKNKDDPPPPQSVENKKSKTSPEQKAQRFVNKARNYLIAAASKAGEAPADLEAAKAAFKAESKFNWPPKDPWNSPYVYKKGEGTNFTIISFGPDGIEGTEDDITPADDINKGMRD